MSKKTENDNSNLLPTTKRCPNCHSKMRLTDYKSPFKGVNWICDRCAIFSDEQLPTENKHMDAVHRPSHYTTGNIECIDAIQAAVVGLSGIEAVCTGTAIKYLWRWKKKNGIEDLYKAKWYIDRLIKENASE